MAVVRVLPANSESAVVDNHDEDALPLHEVSLMICENVSNVLDLLTVAAGIHD